MSIITTMNSATIENAIAKSNSTYEVLQNLGFLPHVTYYKELRERCQQLNLELPRRSHTTKMKPLTEVMTENSTYSRAQLKKRLIEDSILKSACEQCGISDSYNGKPIILQLDHINGINNDNRLENLRLLCPNCHSQTDNWCGKGKNSFNKNRQKKPKNANHKDNCQCGEVKSISASLCQTCARKKSYKIDWPDIPTLIAMLDADPFITVAKSIGCSDNAIRKHLRSNNINHKTLKPLT